MDWKVLGLRHDFEGVDDINSADDLEAIRPGAVDSVRDFYQKYKTADGKPENEYAFGGKVISAGDAMAVVRATGEQWARLKKGEVDNTSDHWLQ